MLGKTIHHINMIYLMFLSSACVATLLLWAQLWLHRGLQTARQQRVDEGDGGRPPGQALRPQRLLHPLVNAVSSESQSVQQ